MKRYRIRHLLREKSARAHEMITTRKLCEDTGLDAEKVDELLYGKMCKLRNEDERRLATYFKCRLEEIEEKPIRIKFDLKTAFPPGDDLAAIILRLLVAANDVDYLRGAYLDHDIPQGEGPFEEIRTYEKHPLFFWSIGCLKEGIDVFKHLVNNTEWKKIESGLDGEGQKVLQELLKCRDKSGQLYKMFKDLRDKIGFHYKSGDYTAALNSINQRDGDILVGPTSPETRFMVADDIRSEVFRSAIDFDNPNGQTDLKIKTVFDVAHALVIFSSSILIAYLDYRKIQYRTMQL